jgi:hypothetical protein
MDKVEMSFTRYLEMVFMKLFSCSALTCSKRKQQNRPYASSAKNKSEFQIDNLKVYGVVMGLLDGDRVRREDGYAFISYREMWEGCQEAGILSGYEVPFAVMMDMVSVVEEGGLIGRERVSGGSWVGVSCNEEKQIISQWTV